MQSSWWLLVVGLFCVAAQACVVNNNADYDTSGDSVTLYGLTSATACCSACSGFVDCQYWSWVSSSSSANYQQCVIKNSNAKPISSTTNQAGANSVNTLALRTSLQCLNPVSNTDYNNGFLSAVYSVTSGSSCCSLCLNYTGCNYWVYAASSGGCYLKGSNSNLQSSSGLQAGQTVPNPISVLRTQNNAYNAKRGVAWFNSNSCSDLQLLTGVSWIYNWDYQPNPYLMGCMNQLGIEFIPMQHSAPLSLSTVYTQAKYLLTFNEPNFAAQANLTPAQAASYWPQIQSFAAQYGMKISSPSASAGGDLMDPIAWFDQFFGNCTGCKVDFLTTHIYTCSVQGLINYVNSTKKYNLPIWLTEFSCPSAGGSPPTSFVQQVTAYLDSDPQIARYSWFGTRIAPSDTWLGSQVNIFSSTGAALTTIGQLYGLQTATPVSATTTTTTGKAATTTTTAKAATTTTTTTAKAATTSTTGAKVATSTTGKAATTGSSSTTGGGQSNYLGCYVDSATRDFTGASTSSSNNTLEKCKYYCAERLYSYIGTQYGIECYCGNSYGSEGTAPASDCNITCSGNSGELCGGNWRNSVYPAYTAAQIGYLGCFVDSATRDLPDFALTSATMTIDQCRQTCSSAGYAYAGLQYGTECHCGNSYGSQGTAPQTDCNMACSGDATELCGAGYRNSIFTSQPATAYMGY